MNSPTRVWSPLGLPGRSLGATKPGLGQGWARVCGAYLELVCCLSARQSRLSCTRPPSHNCRSKGDVRETLGRESLSYSKATVPLKPPRADLADRRPAGQIQSKDVFVLAIEVVLKMGISCQPLKE